MYFLITVAILQSIAAGMKWHEGSKMLAMVLVLYAVTNVMFAFMESN